MKDRPTCTIKTTQTSKTNTVLPVEFHIATVTSTNDEAKELLRYYPFVMVTADEQTNGRGRRGRTWVSTHGNNLLCSFGIRHTVPQSSTDTSAWMGRAALSVLEVVRTHAPQATIRLKYPNDIHVKVRDEWCKISGMLVEHEFIGSTCASTVVGIGLNVLQEQGLDTIAQPYTSLFAIGASVDVPTVRRSMRDAFAYRLDSSAESIVLEWEHELLQQQTALRITGESGDWFPRSLLHDGRLTLTDATQQRQRVVSDGDSLQYLD